MSQFRIKGIDYVDDSLQHGLGKGSGRGRPLGSKNGQVMPGAAYMKDYKIVGQKAEGDANLPGASKNTSIRPIRRLGETIGEARSRGLFRPTSHIARPAPKSRTASTSAPVTNSSIRNKLRNVSMTEKLANKTASSASMPRTTPTENVARGRQAVESLINRGSNRAAQQTQPTQQAQTAQPTQQAQTAQTTQQTQNTRELAQPNNTQNEINDSPYSSRRIKEAGGLESRAGRQIVYDNPNLDQGFKKQVAKRYGDSDGKWYPQKMEQTAADQPEPKDNPWSERRINEAGGLESREGRQYVYDNPTLNEDYKKQLAKRYGDSDGRSYPKEMPAVKPQPETTSQNQASTPNTSEPSQGNMLEQVRNVANGVGNMANDLGRQAGNFINGIGQQLGNIFDGSRNQAPNPGSNSGETSPREAAVTNEASAPETPEQKSFWDNLGGWFEQAGKDIGNTAVGAWNTVSGAAGDAAKWVGDRFNDAGNWASTAYNDVKDWVGARGKEFGDWAGNAVNDVGNFVSNTANNISRGANEFWNGRDVEVNDNGRWRQGHEPGMGERIGNFFNDLGQGVANTANDAWNGVTNIANDVGRGVNEFWNGRDVEVNDNGRWRQGHEPGMGERIGNFFNDAGQGIADTANNVWNGVTDAANNAWQGVSDTANNVWNGVTGAANAAGQAVGNFINGVQPGTRAGTPYYDVQRGQWVDPTMPSLGERVSNFVNDAGRTIGNVANDAWNGVTNAATNGWNAATNAINDAGRALDYWWNGDNGSQRKPFDPGRTLSEWSRGNFSEPLFDSDVARAFNRNVVNPVFGVQNNDGVRGLIRDNIVTPVANAANGVGDFVRDNVVTPVSNAVNDAGRAVNNWWNGEDQSFLGIPTGHTPGARENIANTFNNIGRGIADTASNAWNGVTNAVNDAGRAVNNWWNGEDQSILGIPTGHTPGFRENATRWANDNFVTPVANALNNVGQTANNLWNGTDQTFLGIPTGHTPGIRENIENGLGQAGKWVGDTANNVGRAVTDAANAVGKFAGDTVNGAGQWLNNAGQWVGDTANNVGRAVTDAANAVGNFAGDTVNGAGQWLNNAGQLVGDTANNLGTMANYVVNHPYEVWNGSTRTYSDNVTPLRYGGLKDFAPEVLGIGEPSYVTEFRNMQRDNPEYQAYRNAVDERDFKRGNWDDMNKRWWEDRWYNLTHPFKR